MLKHLKGFGDDLRTLGNDIDLPLLGQITTVCRHHARRAKWHTHRGWEIIFMLEGATEAEFRQHPNLELLGAHFLAIPAGLIHRPAQGVRTPSTQCRLLVNPKCRSARNILFSRGDLRYLERRLARLGPVVCPFGTELRAVLNRLMEAQHAYEANRHDRLLKINLRLWGCAAVLGVFRELGSTHKSRTNELVTATEEYLKQHVGEPVRMPDLVCRIGLGRTRLTELFTEVTGLTPRDYLLRLRIRKAKELLLKPEFTLTEIAMGCGFSSSQHFSSIFRKYTSQAPRRYRRATRSHASSRPAN